MYKIIGKIYTMSTVSSGCVKWFVVSYQISKISISNIYIYNIMGQFKVNECTETC